MKSSSSKRNFMDGSTAVVALIILGMGSVGLSSLIAIIHARGNQVEAMETAFLRRVRELNSRQLAKEFAYRQIMANSTGTATTLVWSYDDGDGDTSNDNWARITVDAWSDSPFSTTTLAASNPLSPGGQTNAFAATANVTVFGGLTSTGAWDPDSGVSYDFRLCGKNPAQAGILFGSQRVPLSSNSVSGALTVNGRSYFYQPTDNVSPPTESYEYSAANSNARILDLSGVNNSITQVGSTDETIPDNTPFVGYINNYVGGIANDGSLSVVWDGVPTSLRDTSIAQGAIYADPVTPGSSNGITVGNSRDVTIDLDNTSLPHVLIPDGASTVILQGQTTAAEEIAASTMAPLIVVIKDSTNGSPLVSDPDVELIQCTGNNTRPLIVGMLKSPIEDYELQFSGTTSFRMIYIAESSTTVYNVLGADVAIEGGVFVDSDFVQSDSGGTLTINPDSDPSDYDAIAPRWGWVEMYRQP